MLVNTALSSEFGNTWYTHSAELPTVLATITCIVLRNVPYVNSILNSGYCLHAFRQTVTINCDSFFSSYLYNTNTTCSSKIH